ncbi:MAG: hypothetical protein R3F59_38655 [Myxococcota bacterium]
MSRAVYAGLWVALLLEALLLAPPPRPDQTAWLLDLMLGRWSAHEPLAVGAFPAPRRLAVRDGRAARPAPAPPRPAVAVRAGLDGPGLVRAAPGPRVGGPAPALRSARRWLRHPLFPAPAGGAHRRDRRLDGAARRRGLWFWRLFRGEQFVHVDDPRLRRPVAHLHRRRAQDGGPWPACFVPLFGALAYAGWRRE